MTATEAKDRLECWSRLTRWRKVTDRPVPEKWLRYGEPPTSALASMTVCLDAYFGHEALDSIFHSSSVLLDYLRERR